MFKVLIRPLVVEDALTSWRWRNDPEIWKYTGQKPDISITEEVERRWLKSKILEKNSSRFAIMVDDNYIGNIQLTNIQEKACAEFHIFIGEKSYWGQGIAKLAIKQLCTYAKRDLQLKNIYLFVNPEHSAAIRLYENVGFKRVNEEVKMVLNLSEFQPPLVSVFMMVYNHGNYLEQALESILMQKCNFDYEIVIGEDNSRDNSREILLRFKKKYPSKFRLILNSRNIGAIRNQKATLKACYGEYIAMLEGDDYWTDPNKLQQQVDFLEANPEYVLTHNDASVVDEKGKRLKDSKLSPSKKKDFTARELQEGVSLATLTLCFRNIILNMPLDFPNVINGDYALVSILGLHGKGKYLGNIKPACYRVHSGGIWSKIIQVKKNTAKYGTFEEMSMYYFRMGNKELGKYYRKKLKQQFRIIIINYLRNKNFKEALGYSSRFARYYIKSFFY